MPRAKLRTDDLREHVLRVAMAMLEREGIREFTARRIAQQAGTSTPAVYELFGDKSGLVRELFFEGFRLLRRHFDELAETSDKRADLIRVIQTLRRFVREHPVLSDVMFSRPFADFAPGPADLKAGGAVRGFILGRVRRCIEAGVLSGNDTDLAHVIMGLVQGLAAQERAGWLGTSKASIERRWELSIRAVLDGLTSEAQRR